jgi:hypothetical protein
MERLDLDDIGPHDGQLIGGGRAGQYMGEIHHPDSIERFHLLFRAVGG